MPWFIEKFLRINTKEFRAGFSLGDLLGALKSGMPILVWHEGAVFRLSLKNAWFTMEIPLRQNFVDKLQRVFNAKRLNITEVRRILDSLLPFLNLHQVGPLPSNRLMDARPIADLKPEKLGPDAKDIRKLRLLPAPPGILD
jgi:hypothetical protein